ncbi:MAG: J domain-containing protein [Proteobacteria bacterium]|nr:MAG: J domain-containing protein [Pseudomonadota bacterium]
MQKIEALKILGFASGTKATHADLKSAYRTLCRTYHPDINPAGEIIMKQINAAWEALKGLGDSLASEDLGNYAIDPDLLAKLSKALQAIVVLEGLEIEICGSWIWLAGNTMEHREAIKAAGYRWAATKKKWYFRTQEDAQPSRKAMSMDYIRKRYGSQSYGDSEKRYLA